MKKIGTFLFLAGFIGAVIFFSCKRQLHFPNSKPIANAGKDTALVLPADSAVLNGSASTDPDNNISGYGWRKITGPSSSIILNSSSVKTPVTRLAEGAYQFELKVTDAGGLFSLDTVLVTVSPATATNRPPIADAGKDTVIILPANAVKLDGSSSKDPDNNITGYSWAKISGPSSFNITSTTAVQTQVTNLEQGIYQFELKVTDAGGLFSKDTVQVAVNTQIVPPPACDNSNRPTINAQLIPFGVLSKPAAEMAVAAAGNKIVFAGRSTDDKTVDIYDLLSQTWSTAELSVARTGIAAVAAGNKIFFGGGEIGDGTWPVNVVDIYDVAANTWSASALSTAGNGIAAATVGNKVFFAGGDGGFTGPGRSNRVDIYDLITNTWSTALLNVSKRDGLSAVSVNNKIYFAGGETFSTVLNAQGYYTSFASDRIDIYDNTTNTWSVSSLQEGKIAPAAVAVGNKIFWAGGITGNGTSATSYYTSCVVEIRDVITGSSTTQNLFRPASWSVDAGQNAVVKNNKIIFYRANGTDTDKFDIYDIAANTWSIGVLPVHIEGASVIAVNNTIYVAGGLVNGVLSNQVWKLEF